MVVAVLRGVFGSLAPSERLLDISPTGFRQRWDLICGRLGLNHSQPFGLTPACLRGSGATHLYRNRVSIPDIAWMGRWRQTRNLEYYLQEVAGIDFLHGLGADQLDRIALLGRVADHLVQRVLVEGCPLGAE